MRVKRRSKLATSEVFLLEFDDRHADQWFLSPFLDFSEGAPLAILTRFRKEDLIADFEQREVDATMFRRGERVEAPDLRARIYSPGQPVDFSFATAMHIPVLSTRIATPLKTVAGDDIQLIPLKVEGIAEEFYVLNILRVLDCIDHKRTVGRQEPSQDGDVEYSSATDLRVRAGVVGASQIARPKGWRQVIIAGALVKQVLEDAGATGVRYKPVS